MVPTAVRALGTRCRRAITTRLAPTTEVTGAFRLSGVRSCCGCCGHSRYGKGRSRGRLRLEFIDLYGKGGAGHARVRQSGVWRVGGNLRGCPMFERLFLTTRLGGGRRREVRLDLLCFIYRARSTYQHITNTTGCCGRSKLPFSYSIDRGPARIYPLCRLSRSIPFGSETLRRGGQG